MNQLSVTFPCGDILLEGVWHSPEVSQSSAVIVCHPHPLYGGDMSNNVVVAICQTLARQSIAAFRFNFRGAGKSEGVFGKGIAEQEDIRAALSFVSSSKEIDPERIGLAGYSFGATVALPVAVQDERVGLLALVSPPLSGPGWEQLERYDKPKFLIVGDDDPFISLERLQQYARDIPDPRECQVVPGVDHFWWGYEEKVTQKVTQFFADGFNQA